MSLHGFVKDQIENNREMSLTLGVIQRDVASTGERVYALVPTFENRTQLWGPMRWVKEIVEGNCHATGCEGEAHIRYPQKGDEALIGITHTGEPWVLGYGPEESEDV